MNSWHWALALLAGCESHPLCCPQGYLLNVPPLNVDALSTKDLKKGEGAVVPSPCGQAAAFRDHDGVVHRSSGEKRDVWDV